jgi:DNA-binding NarL/FixJ family response regulator
MALMKSDQEGASVVVIGDGRWLVSSPVVRLREHPAIAIVGTVERGQDVLSKVKETRPDVVVVDLSMAGMNGLDTVYRLRAALPEIGIVAISAWDTRSSRRSAAESGADVFVAKKQSSKGLVEAICFASKGNTHANQKGPSSCQPLEGGTRSIIS